MGGDLSSRCVAQYDNDFNPHHPCGWWPRCGSFIAPFLSISIHTTRVGGDPYLDKRMEQRQISIHTTRVGGDYIIKPYQYSAIYFNPHHPCGWWLRTQNHWGFIVQNFNPHHPCGWWPDTRLFFFDDGRISIHTTRVGGDFKVLQHLIFILYFNPHHPCGWWHPANDIYKDMLANFNPHHPGGWWLLHYIQQVF